MTQQVSRSLQFYLASGSGREQPEKIIVCGGCANIAGVDDVIASRVGIPAERGDPLGQMKNALPRQGAGGQEGRHRVAHGLWARIAELRLMPRINLLPWRAEERKKRQREFAFAAIGAVVAAGAVALLLSLVMSNRIDRQNEKNQILKTEIEKLNRQITEINGLDNQKQRLLARMEIIQKLQRSRPEVVHLFDQLVRTLPDGVYLTSVKQSDKRLVCKGMAQSSTRVSAFMRNIDDSEWLDKPELEVVETKKDAALGSEFTLFANQVGVQLPGEGEE